jgi:hypothetical protein
VYGFVGSITTVIATAVYVAWAYTPEPALRSLGITYYPSKYEMLLQFSLTLLPSLRCASSSCGRFFFCRPFGFCSFKFLNPHHRNRHRMSAIWMKLNET